MRVALSTAKIGFTFVDLGISPGLASTHFLPQLVGHELAFRLLATAEMIDGVEAHRIGLVCELVDADSSVDAHVNAASVVERAMTLAKQMSSKPPTAVRVLTRSMRMRHERDLDRSLWREADSQAQCFAAPAFKPSLEAVRDRVQKSKKSKK
jgi:enoyl-CoA hydratase/carnithine racemase